MKTIENRKEGQDAKILCCLKINLPLQSHKYVVQRNSMRWCLSDVWRLVNYNNKSFAWDFRHCLDHLCYQFWANKTLQRPWLLRTTKIMTYVFDKTMEIWDSWKIFIILVGYVKRKNINKLVHKNKSIMARCKLYMI